MIGHLINKDHKELLNFSKDRYVKYNSDDSDFDSDD
jgi:hypothetical protein